ncbi:MAG TPA: serine hydrolase domain-containing protein [Gemmatimonadaceae bacterium]|nr:serine hydrolase domain-containing protein [Gemmatimonadaceae bacterium]
MKAPTITLAIGMMAVAAPLATPLAAQHGATAADIAASVDSVAARIVSAGVSPAIGVAVVMDGRIIYEKAHGWADVTNRIPADDHTLWYVASTSKSYTGFGVSLLATRGALSFDEPIGKLLPGVRWPAYVDPATLTLARFLSHTHYMNDAAVVQSAAFTGAIPEARWPDLIRYAPSQGNRDLVYSNFGYNVAAMVIDRLRPEGWRRYLEDNVYRPAGLAETYTHLSGLDPKRIAHAHGMNDDGSWVTRRFEKTDRTMNSAGGHVATLRDLARWTIVQMDGGKIDGKQVFPPEAVSLAHRLIARHTVEASRHFGPFNREGWGAGWDLGAYRGEPMVSRFGGYSSIRSHLSFLPARHIGVVAQVTGTGASAASDIVATLAYDLDAGRPGARAAASAKLDSMVAALPTLRARIAAAEAQRRARQVPLQHPLDAFAGSYFNEAYGTLEFVVQGGALAYRWGVLDGPAEVFDASKDQLRIEIADSGSVVGFTFDGSEPAKAITWQGVTFTRRQ